MRGSSFLYAVLERYEKTPILLHAKEQTAWPDLIEKFEKAKEMYGEFIENGIGVIRLWEQVWIMCWNEEKGMDGMPESLDKPVCMNTDGALISDV